MLNISNIWYDSRFIFSVSLILLFFSVYVCCKDARKHNQRNEANVDEFNEPQSDATDSKSVNPYFNKENLVEKFEQQASFNDGCYEAGELSEANDEQFLSSQNESDLDHSIRRRRAHLPPPRALSDFFWFSLDERKKIMEEHPSFYDRDILRELTRRWNNVEPHIKKKYEAIANEDKARYEREMLEYEKKVRESNEKIEAKEKKDENYI